MTEDVATDSPTPPEVSRSLTEDHLRAALNVGIEDFKAVPIFGLFFAAFCLAGGLGLWFGLVNAGQAAWHL